MKANKEIREHAKNKGIFLWEIAEIVGVNDGNFSRKLRRELSESEKQEIIKIIDELAEKKAAALAAERG